MKCIVLAKMGKRIFAAIIDFLLTLAVAAALFFALVLPVSLDEDAYYDNVKEMNLLKDVSGLYVATTSEDGSSISYDLIIDVTVSKLSGVNDPNAIPYFNSMKYGDKTISVIDSLANFYINPPVYNNENIFSVNKLSFEVCKETVFKVGSAISNIQDLYINDSTGKYEISLINIDNQQTTIDYISQLILPDNYESTVSVSEMVINCSEYKKAEEENKNAMLFSILMLIPTLFGVSLITYFIIPIASKNGETVGKYILGLGVLSADGYVLKKYHHIPRFLGFFCLEFAGGILSFGGLFLVSYIMFCFSKKRRCIHDFIGSSVVIDKKESTWFVDRDQEYRYNYKTRIE